MITKNIILSLMVCTIYFLNIFLIPILSDVVMKIELLFYIKSISVFQGGVNSTYFRIISEYNDTLYFVTPKYLAPQGIHVSFNPANIYELPATERPVVAAQIVADENALNGTNILNFWVESTDSDGNKVKSQIYSIDIAVLINSTLPGEKTSISTSTFTSTAASTISPSITTTSNPFFPSDNEINSEKSEGVSKMQVLIILVVVLIFLIIIPIFSFKEKSSQKVFQNESK